MSSSSWTNKIYRRKRVNFLKYFAVIKEVMVVTHGIKKSDFDILLYLDDIVYFTKQHFLEGMLWQIWDAPKWKRLQTDGWIGKFHKGGANGDPSRYKLTLKGRKMVTKVYKVCYGEEKIPIVTNPIMKGKSYKHRKLKQVIELFNQEIQDNERSKFTN